MGSGITVEIRIKPYLKEFLIAFYGGHHPVEASKKNVIGTYLEPLLERPPEKLPGKNKDDTYITILIPEYHGRRPDSYNYISEHNQKVFNNMVHAFFKELMLKYVDDRMRLGFTKKDSIYQFCHNYKIPFDKVNYEMLKKKYDRHKKSVANLKKNYGKNVDKLSRSLSHIFTAKLILL